MAREHIDSPGCWCKPKIAAICSLCVVMGEIHEECPICNGKGYSEKSTNYMNGYVIIHREVDNNESMDNVCDCVRLECGCILSIHGISEENF